MISASDILGIPVLADLSETARAAVIALAADVRLGDGDWLFHEGAVPAFFIVLSGSIAVSKRVGQADVPFTIHTRGDFFGELPLLLNTPTVASLRAIGPTRVLRLDASDFREHIMGSPTVSEHVIRALVKRVDAMQRLAVDTPITSVTIVGHAYEAECHAIRNFLARNHVPFAWVEPENDETPGDGLAGNGDRFPMLLFADGPALVAPSFREVADRLNLQTAGESDVIYDLVVVGAGPAGLAAGVYGASEGLRTLLIERQAPGGQAGSSSRIENYLGFPAGLSGEELSRRAWQQAKRLGAQMLTAREVTRILPGAEGAPHGVTLDDGEVIAARSVVLATGVSWRSLEAPGIAALSGRGVYYGAARTEAHVNRGKDIYMIGGGNSAGQAAMFFADYARSVTLLVRGTSLAASMSQYLIDQLATKNNIEIRVNTVLVEAQGADHLEAIVVRNVVSGEATTLATDALFILIGAIAETAALPATMRHDAMGFIFTGRDILDDAERRGCWPLAREPYPLESSVPGIFAAGDVRYGSIKRVAASVGEGSTSIAFVHQYLEGAEKLAVPAISVRA